jgi:hypothetical protein
LFVYGCYHDCVRVTKNTEKEKEGENVLANTVIRIVHEEAWKRKSIEVGLGDWSYLHWYFQGGILLWLCGREGQQHAFSFFMRGLGRI